MKLWMFLLASVALAQPAFDVASVKQGGPVRPDGLLNIDLGHANNGVVTLTNTTLSEMVRYAYGLTNEDQIAGPGWIKDRQYRYELVGKAAPDTKVETLRLMLQTLLKERFRLELHQEPRKITHLILERGKAEPKVTPSSPDEASSRVISMPGHLQYRRIAMNTFVALISRFLKQPVLDRTGLTGVYDLKLEWTPDDAVAPTDSAPTPKPDIFTAVQQQLGLKLEVSKEPLEVLVVDKAEKVPLEN